MSLRPVTLGIAGAVFGILTVWILMYLTQTKATDTVASIALLIVVPLLAAGIAIRAPAPSPEWLAAGKVFVAFSILSTGALGLLLPASPGALPPELSRSLPILAGVLSAAAWRAVLRFPSMQSQLNRRRAEVLADACLVGSLAFMLVIFSPLDPDAPGRSTLLLYIFQVGPRRFIRWLVAGVLFAAAVVWLLRREAGLSPASGRRAAAIGLALAVLFVLSLYDDSHFADHTHYQAYIAPALFARAGGVPMVDIYSQYGLLPWALIALSYLVLPATSGTAAIVVRLVDVAYLLLFVLMAFTLARRRLAALAFMVPMIIAGTVWHPGLYDVADLFNLHALPSLFGMRYLPIAGMALVLAFDLRKRAVRLASLAVLVISSFWSLDACVFSLLIWAGALLVEGLRERRIPIMLVQVATGLLVVLATHLAFAFVTWAWTGRIVSYLPYLDMVQAISSVDKNEVAARAPWTQPINYRYLWWAPVWLAYFLCVALAVVGAWRGEPRGTAGRSLAIALFGISTLSYFVTRSSTAALALSFLPFSVLFMLAFEALVLDRSRYGTIAVPASRLAAVLLALVFAFGFERFTRPVTPVHSNSTILRHCFSREGCAPGKVAARIAAATQITLDPNYMNILYYSNASAYVEDMVQLLRTHTPGEKRVAILPDNWHHYVGYVILSITGQWYKWPMSNVVGEQQSAVNTARILAGSTMRDGELLIVAKPETSLLLLEQRILAKVRAQCRFAPVAETKLNSVYRMEACR